MPYKSEPARRTLASAEGTFVLRQQFSCDVSFFCPMAKDLLVVINWSLLISRGIHNASASRFRLRTRSVDVAGICVVGVCRTRPIRFLFQHVPENRAVGAPAGGLPKLWPPAQGKARRSIAAVVVPTEHGQVYRRPRAGQYRSFERSITSRGRTYSFSIPSSLRITAASAG